LGVLLIPVVLTNINKEKWMKEFIFSYITSEFQFVVDLSYKTGFHYMEIKYFLSELAEEGRVDYRELLDKVRLSND
jgi:hypothetical protein